MCGSSMVAQELSIGSRVRSPSMSANRLGGHDRAAGSTTTSRPTWPPPRLRQPSTARRRSDLSDTVLLDVLTPAALRPWPRSARPWPVGPRPITRARGPGGDGDRRAGSGGLVGRRPRGGGLGRGGTGHLRLGLATLGEHWMWLRRPGSGTTRGRRWPTRLGSGPPDAGGRRGRAPRHGTGSGPPEPADPGALPGVGGTSRCRPRRRSGGRGTRIRSPRPRWPRARRWLRSSRPSWSPWRSVSTSSLGTPPRPGPPWSVMTGSARRHWRRRRRPWP